MGRILLIGLLLAATLACLPASKKIVTQSRTDPASVHRLVPGVSVFVVENPEAESPALVHDLAVKISDILVQKGFERGSSSDAEFFLLFDFGTETYRGRGPGMRGIPGTGGIRYDHFFEMSLIDARVYREGRRPSVIWRGDATLTDTHSKNPEDPLGLIDRLLVDLLEQFGRTKKLPWED